MADRKEKRARIRNIKDTTANWNKANPILLDGEIGVEMLDDGSIAIKVGDGQTAWKLLKYVTKTIAESDAERDALQKQVDNIVVASAEGESAEVAQARVDVNGTNFATLKDRLDADQNALGQLSLEIDKYNQIYAPAEYPLTVNGQNLIPYRIKAGTTFIVSNPNRNSIRPRTADAEGNVIDDFDFVAPGKKMTVTTTQDAECWRVYSENTENVVHIENKDNIYYQVAQHTDELSAYRNKYKPTLYVLDDVSRFNVIPCDLTKGKKFTVTNLGKTTIRPRTRDASGDYVDEFDFIRAGKSLEVTISRDAVAWKIYSESVGNVVSIEDHDYIYFQVAQHNEMLKSDDTYILEGMAQHYIDYDIKAGHSYTIRKNKYAETIIVRTSADGSTALEDFGTVTRCNSIEVVPKQDAMYWRIYTTGTTEISIVQTETLLNSVDVLNDNKDHNKNKYSELFKAQKYIAEDWHFPFIDVFGSMALGGNHVIPNTKTTWYASGTKDLTQREVAMQDNTHPFTGNGIQLMYAETIANQIALVSPSYFNKTALSGWEGKTFIWMGTSIPAGSDPALGADGNGLSYPSIVAQKLGASVINIAMGSSCVRANSSGGDYNKMRYNHFLRSITRMANEADFVASNYDAFKSNIVDAPDVLPADAVAIMKNLSFENLVKPYLDGTKTMPDCFVIDYGHNDVAPLGKDGKSDLHIDPTVNNINAGLLAEDTYMTENDYSNLKLALNNDLSGIDDLKSFSASLNRNCFKGAMNFLITLILRYNPHARIILVSDYD